MPLTPFDPDPVQTLEEFGVELAARRAAVGARDGGLIVPRNRGGRRTPAKRALLERIEDMGGNW